MGLIGCGYWGPNHLRVFNSWRDSKMMMVADKERTRLQRVEECWPNLRYVEDYRVVLAAPEIQAVVVATPTATHYGVVREALEAGKHVLCEKPICSCPTEAKELVSLAQRKHLILMVGHVFLFNAGIRKIKELLDSGELGSPRYLSATRTNLGPVRS